jgi:hypothetical protein
LADGKRGLRQAALTGDRELPNAAGEKRPGGDWRMGQGVGIREIAWLDCAGGGQVVSMAVTPISAIWTRRTGPRWWMSPIRATRALSPRSTFPARGLIYLIDRNRGLSILERT